MCTTELAQLRAKRKQCGFTLIELIIFIVVVSVGITGILSVINTVVKSSADPMLRKQSIAIAESMLEEVLLKDYNNSLGPQTLNRTTWNLVPDANGYNVTGIKDSQNNAIAGLENYKISVTVAKATNADNAALAALSPAAYKVTVTVTDPSANAVTLTGYRASY
jgi:MSHA pilin protein MshD